MNAVCLQVFVSEASRHHGKLTYEWLLDAAQELGVQCGSAFRAVAGFGRHGRHDVGFFELAGELPVVVEFFRRGGDGRPVAENHRRSGPESALRQTAGRNRRQL